MSSLPRPPVLKSAALSKAGFTHGFSTRIGGVSPPPFASLDFALLRDPACLHENLRRFGEAVGFDSTRLFQTKQVHGARVVEANGRPGDWVAEEADALVARHGSGNAVGVRVADCVPILLADTVSGDVAAVHAGWRGITGRAIGAALAQLSTTSRIVAAIGPSIGVCCFEVSREVADQIAASAHGVNVIRAHANPEKAFVDLRAAARAQLVHAGVPNDQIDDVPGCTRCDATHFYSYRRDGDNAGRLIGVIAPT